MERIIDHEHFMNFCGSINQVMYTTHFLKDIKHKPFLKDIDKQIVNPNACGFTELHKFEERIEGVDLFRAKKKGVHIVYGITETKDLIFLRAIKSFMEYEKFLSNKKLIKEIIHNL